MLTPLANADSLRIGSVDFVSPDEIKVLLDIEAPNDVALNTGVPRPFPRINSYALIPSDNGFLVAQIEWITIERSQYPKRKGIQDFGVIDLPYPLRKMSLNPLGILKEKLSGSEATVGYEFSRGIEMFPTVGDPVLLPTQEQLKSIVESGSKRRVNIGVSPLAGNAVVSIDPDRLFGRHLAILGNTGSGKSCSVAGVIRWSIEAAKAERKRINKETEELLGDLRDEDREKLGLSEFINSRFIILDPNGEYANSFNDLSNVRVFAAEEDSAKGIHQLHIPLWFWNSAEWSAFTQASSRAQRPTLIQALRTVRDGQMNVEQSPSHDMRRYLRTLVSLVSIEISAGSPWAGGGRSKGFGDRVSVWENGLTDNALFSPDEQGALNTLRTEITNFRNANASTGQNRNEWPNYPKPAADRLLSAIIMTHSAFGGSDQDALPIDADIPRPFTGDQFLRSIEANSEIMNTSEYVDTMLMRIRTLLSDSKLKRITGGNPDLTLEQWLNEYICPSDKDEGSVSVIDLSLVPTEVTHIITAVIARMTLEALQRYRKLHEGKTLPTTLVMEEAHTFIKRYNADNEDGTATEMCAKVFEKIAREGRKFGLGLVLSSQRPSELSPTVLSQCNSFLLHRISNDRDQELVSKLVPDNLRGLLRELPSLPSRNAILLGWASELPVSVQMSYLKEEHRPQSNDPDYWDAWTNKERMVNWKEIADNWQSTEQVQIKLEETLHAEFNSENEGQLEDDTDDTLQL
jgi:DNA helicase HerA-like ATPase